MTPGLANKIALRFASKIFVTFEEAAKHLPKEKVIYTGSPVREEVLKGNREKGLAFLGFHIKASYYDYGRQLGREKLMIRLEKHYQNFLKVSNCSPLRKR